MTTMTARLEQAKTIAVAGCSPRESRPSYRIARYLQRAGYRVIPVNPNAREILGEDCYPSVSRIPADIQIDIVDIFRRSRYTAEVVTDTLERAKATGQWPAIWTQLAVSSPQAERLASENGLPYIRERCIRVEHARLFGEPGAS